MGKEIVSSKQMINIIILFILGTAFVAGGTAIAKQDSWISIILAFLLLIPIYLVYGKLNKLYPNKNVFEMFYECFGKIGGATFTIIFTLFSLHLGALVIRNFTEFIQVVSLSETPQYAAAIFIGVLCIWTVKSGIEILARGAMITGPIVIIVTILTVVLNINNMDLSYIQPIFGAGFGNILSNCTNYISFPFGEAVLFLSVMPCLKSKANPHKVYLMGTAIGCVILVMGRLRNTLVLGLPTLESLYFPSYTSVGIINIKEFITRIEVLMIGNFILSGLAKVCVCIYVTCKGFAHLFNVANYKDFAAPVALMMIAISAVTSSSTMEMMAYLKPYKYYAPVIEIFVPFLLLVVTLIKKPKKNSTLVAKE
ncbi:spore germination protein KB [Hydrogenoanaerobacterium saccharovorans]|uniref:Spore germination protein KB n=1 Tax=Hydrogenoanaerobacterium saccharovorans TaxID=474960 RepID=A0A1H8DFG4_9FIRM|nr:endospore germination permease [Hydrogenoanaerobacterium saccharovorans]RPF42184.1 spore germination protein KB [Hydrogenoanaerobacterium saccharovorans]SEN06022.1 spore germination protein KB [Hydrogenoanaerobacterium saccharovorans]